MATEREIRETVARCVSIMVCYHNDERTRRTTRTMAAEVRAVASWVRGMGLAPGETDRRILRPLEAELLARCEQESARRLKAEFLRAFEGEASPAPIFTPSLA